LIVCSSVYCLRGDDVLLLKRRKPPFVGLWVAPGGKANAGESPPEAAHRELQEETGLRAQRLLFRGVIAETSPRADFQWLIFYYAALEIEGCLSEEGPEGELCWWPRGRLPDLPQPDADRVFTVPVLDLLAPVYQGHFRYNASGRLIDYLEHDSLVPTSFNL